jgi:hypothetical protein
MTSKTQKYIDLSDFLTLKLTCVKCQSSLEIPILRNLSGREDAKKLDCCPICLTEWASRDDGRYHQLISGFTGSLRSLKEATESAKLGFALTIEVTDEKPKDEKP